MEVVQLYTKCLAHGAYFISSNGEAAIIDPLRETEPYLQMAEDEGVKIKYILETHFHADFVSGHLDLAKKTGAKIIYGPTATPNFDAYIAEDGELLALGDLTIKVLHTPGHTMESSSFLLRDKEGKDKAIFTGDTVFLGDVGRPDLAQKAADMTREELAGLLFDSIREKIMVLDDDIIVYPGHGQGSACGKAMSSDTVDTLGNQKESNYALRSDMTRDEFIKEVTDGLLPPPQYFPSNAKMNKMGYESIDDVRSRAEKGYSPKEFEQAMNKEGVFVIDTRDPDAFTQGFINGSLSIGLEGDFAPWVGILVNDITAPILLITDEGQREEAVIRLARVGYDNIQGYLEGGIQAWHDAGKALETIACVSAQEFVESWPQQPVVDSRRFSEYQASRVDGAINLPLDFIYADLQKYPDERFYLHCKGGYRSVAAASVLAANGIKNVINITGGFDAMVEAGLPVVEHA
ncbi:MBL fold metallo-hydrolase [Sanyastnella coralliicola]|uniref:MBL fold metallo-hydrolase n=1 Tax=Sanyastnella coralliicola TaxID=3069118 RepID=UPI0027B9444C|nr:rhodanese-like domain-containing protein [Longitalea sp. SCSIO 12813]